MVFNFNQKSPVWPLSGPAHPGGWRAAAAAVAAPVRSRTHAGTVCPLAGRGPYRHGGKLSVGRGGVSVPGCGHARLRRGGSACLAVTRWPADNEEDAMPDYRYLTYELLDEGTIARIMLNRPAARNAQNRGLLVELGEAMLAAEADDQVRVVILGGAGPLFSAGHDLGSADSIAERTAGPAQHSHLPPVRWQPIRR